MNLNNNDTEIPEVQLEEFALQLCAKDFAYRGKAKAKPRRIELAGSRIVPIEESNSSSSFCESTSRRRWSGSFLENKAKSSEPIPTIYSLV